VNYDAHDEALADQRVARALEDENAPYVGWATRQGVIMWRCLEAEHRQATHDVRETKR
jgi:hypothetical protein